MDYLGKKVMGMNERCVMVVPGESDNEITKLKISNDKRSKKQMPIFVFYLFLNQIESFEKPDVSRIISV
jgi:hypothetical protein